ncbi:regulatory protein, luxR family [Paracoccus halophilus]|uniref:Regulatory protein, luxR family n=1 Tax=Paracoccus halophilus TaxID=376733 RepID=A0A1I0U0Y5_9RHOB|nr:LuxR family transcriptional regulator [Paracoccus halophilus]SFA57714.1 regulatory protein, luxR family [Paracoccus halophilus]
MLDAVERILSGRSAESVWQSYVESMTRWGFPHVSYQAVRLLRTFNARVIDDSILLSSHAPRLLHELLAQNLVTNTPMYRWIERNIGSESWDWLNARRIAGRLSDEELRVLELFRSYGYVAGYAISLGDTIQRVRAGVILNGAVGQQQDKLDGYWTKYRREIEALTGIVHLRLTNLPYNQPDEVLTLRQREVLESISIGRTTQEIAELLDLTPATVEKHLRLARKALGARTTAQAILLASSRRQIFLDPGEPCTVQSGGSQRGTSQSGTSKPAAAVSASTDAWRFTSFAPFSSVSREPGKEDQ